MTAAAAGAIGVGAVAPWAARGPRGGALANPCNEITVTQQDLRMLRRLRDRHMGSATVHICTSTHIESTVILRGGPWPTRGGGKAAGIVVVRGLCHANTVPERDSSHGFHIAAGAPGGHAGCAEAAAGVASDGCKWTGRLPCRAAVSVTSGVGSSAAVPGTCQVHLYVLRCMHVCGEGVCIIRNQMQVRRRRDGGAPRVPGADVSSSGMATTRSYRPIHPLHEGAAW